MATAPSWGALNVDNAPCSRPKGVRAPETITIASSAISFELMAVTVGLLDKWPVVRPGYRESWLPGALRISTYFSYTTTPIIDAFDCTKTIHFGV